LDEQALQRRSAGVEKFAHIAAIGAHQIIIVSGSQQASDLCARLLVKSGDQVAVEKPCYAVGET
jgi:DNA-binding transcriptional MocR family regulator